MTVDYAKLDYKDRAHHERYRNHVIAHGFICQECGGMGDYVEDMISYGEGCVPLYYPCGFCEGTGLVTRWMRGQWLRWKKQEKREVR